MSEATAVIGVSVAGGVLSALFIFTYAAKLTYGSFKRQYDYTEEATRLSKVYLALDYIFRNIGWKYAPKKLTMWFVIGFVLVFTGQMFVQGVESVFFS